MVLEVIDKVVMSVKEVKTATQTAIVKEFYCYYYKTNLIYNTETKKVKATVYNYLDEVQTNFLENVIFDYEGNQIQATPINGVASIDFNVTLSGDHIVKTINEAMENGEVIIHVE